MKKYGWCLIIGLIFLFLRLYRIEERVNFSMDQGLFMMRAYEIWQNKEITLIGPTASPIINGRHFFQGPIIYYSLVILGLLGNWNPINISFILALCGLVGMYFIFITIKLISNRQAAWIGALIYCFLPISIEFSNFIWNPNFLLFLTPIFVYFLIKGTKEKSFFWCGISGLMSGICLQYHFQFIPVLGISLLYLIYKNKKLFIPFMVGFIFGYLPLIIFDLRNNFYNIKTMFLWLTGGGKSLGFQWHYVLSFITLVIVPIAILIEKTKPILKYLLLGIIIGWGIIFAMVDNNNSINISVQNILVNKILVNGCPKNFNVASTVEGDTRAYNLRYLLTIKECLPMEIDKYPEAETLFLVAPESRPPENEKVWEVSSLGKIKIVNREKINKKIYFYKIQKDNG